MTEMSEKDRGGRVRKLHLSKTPSASSFPLKLAAPESIREQL